MIAKAKTEIREYVEGLPVEIDELEGRLVVVARNEGGITEVDIDDLLSWIAENRPELLAVKVPGN